MNKISAMVFTSFSQVVQYMESTTNLEKKTDQYSVRTYRLDRMTALLNVLGNPQNCYKTIHIAGSKGKGSTASFIASGIQALGLKTGLYLSPHVSDIRERFTIDGQFADDELLLATGNELASALDGFSFDQMLGKTSVTTFELYTAFAFLLFKNAGCSWAVIETGLGGRLDATNIIVPEASVLTRIELEHTDILGDTIKKIAIEKSKIIKDNVPSFVSIQKEEALDVFKNEAKEKNSKQYYLSDQLQVFETKTTTTGQSTHIVFKDGFDANLNLKLLGQVQAQNCALALLVLRTLGLYKANSTESALENNTLPGRMEKVSFSRPLYLDGAHTIQSITNLMETFKSLYKNGVCIFGCVAGKKYEEMCEQVLKNFSTIVICRPGTFKKSDPEGLYSTLISMAKDGQKIVYMPEAKDALTWIEQNTEKDTPVLACGSFYLAGVIKACL